MVRQSIPGEALPQTHWRYRFDIRRGLPPRVWLGVVAVVACAWVGSVGCTPRWSCVEPTTSWPRLDAQATPPVDPMYGIFNLVWIEDGVIIGHSVEEDTCIVPI